MRRTTVSAEHLTVGLQCGGSDGWSGVTANPALGEAVDRLVSHGGSALLSETPEIWGAEHLLLRRAASQAVADKLQARLMRSAQAFGSLDDSSGEEIYLFVLEDLAAPGGPRVIGTSGIAAWQTSARDGEPDKFLGRPAYACEHCATVGDTGDIILAVWSEYLEGVYQLLNMAESIHVRFLENERAFRFTMRCGGAPWWRSALTPKKSSTTLSPFVKLDAR
jgi:hypothetical protein